MKQLNRRSFLNSVAGGSACVYGILHAKAGPAPDPAPLFPLGNTGITLSRIGQGTGMHGGNRQSNHTRMGFAKLVELFQHGYDHGINFFDLADLYGSHLYFREALRAIPRDKAVILTKLWFRYDGEPAQVDAAFKRKSCDIAIDRFRHELSTDYIDVVLLHCLTTPAWGTGNGAYMDSLSAAKQKQQIRALGVSCHNFEALKTAVQCPWVDVILARINPKGVSMDASVDEVVPVLRQAKANGKAIIGMKIYGEGRLANIKSECIQFAQSLDFLDSMTLGGESTAEMDESLRLIAKYPALRAAA